MSGVLPIRGGGGSNGGGDNPGGSDLPTGYEFKEVGGKLQLTKNGVFLYEVDPTEFRAESGRFGLGSIHIGDIHSNGSANENLVWVNEISNTAWSPAWSGISVDGESVTDSSIYQYGEIAWDEPEGAPVPATSTSYEVNIAPLVENTVFFKVAIVPSENYAGRVVWQANRTDGSLDRSVSKFAYEVNLTSGSEYELQLKYPIWGRVGNSFSLGLYKEDGSPLQVQEGVGGGAYRKLRVRSFDTLYTASKDDLNPLKTSGDTLVTGDLNVPASVAGEMVTTPLIELQNDTYNQGDYVIFDFDVVMSGITYVNNWEYKIGLVHEDDWNWFENNNVMDYATYASKVITLLTDAGTGSKVSRVRASGAHGDFASVAGVFSKRTVLGIYYDSLSGMLDKNLTNVTLADGRYKVCAYSVTDDAAASARVLMSVNNLKVDIVNPYDEALTSRLSKVGININLSK